jgi:signal transduction histidine kinase
MNTAELLRQFSFLSPFSTEQLARVAEIAPRFHYRAGETIFKIGDPSGAMYLILSGKVKIYRSDEKGEEIILSKIDTGSVFGELALLSSEPRMASVTALVDSEFLVIDRNLLLDTIAGASPDSILKLFAVLSNQIRSVNEREFRELLSQRTLAAEMEVERQRALTQMVAGVAHELNTPLGVINTAVSIVERELRGETFEKLAKDPEASQVVEDLQEALGLIKGNVQRAHLLVQDFKKVSVSQLTDVKEPMSLSETVREIVNLAKAHFRQSGLKIEIKDSLTLPEQAWVGYRGYLSQILLNFLTNVQRYAYPDQPGGLAEIYVRTAGPDKFSLSVKDYGQGMPAAVRERVFEPFFTTGRASGGTGLGMAIVHNLVTTALKGSIQVESEPGKGTEITVSFPRSIPD